MFANKQDLPGALSADEIKEASIDDTIFVPDLYSGSSSEINLHEVTRSSDFEKKCRALGTCRSHVLHRLKLASFLCRSLT